MTLVARARPTVVTDDVLDGLRRAPKRLPGRLLDAGDGPRLRAELLGLDDYYPSRTELRLLDASLPVIAREVGVAARVLEPVTGGDIRSRRLMQALDEPAGYLAIGEVTGSMNLPPPRRPHGKTLVFFPRDEVGRFEPHDAVAVLGGLQRIAGPTARLLIAADGTHDPAALQRAYADEDGRNESLTKHVLVHLNDTRDATFDPDTFEHRAVWNHVQSRVELRLVSRIDQAVSVGGEPFVLTANEPIVTGLAYKHSLHAMRGLVLAAGWLPTQVFTAQEQPMRLWLCEPRGV
jgi:uncharacterized SAM-dependent methyltransferase